MLELVASYLAQVLYRLARLPFSLVNHLRYRASLIFASTIDDQSQPTADFARTLAECRYRLDDGTSSSLTLPDGRNLGYAQYGVRVGHAVFYLHGYPGSRIEAASFDPIAARLGVRIIAVDRPGIGWSSPHPNRTILDHAKDIEYLAKQLELCSYGVLGISGGGPYALACAAALPTNELKAISIVCGLGPPNMGYREMCWSNFIGFTLATQYFPGLIRWWVGREPANRLDLTDEDRFGRLQRATLKDKSKTHPKDFAVFSDVDSTLLYLNSSRDSFCQGFDGFLQDGKLISNDFGFRIDDIRSDLPVQLWYGKLDVYVPLSHGEQIAARLGPNAHLNREDETHASISSVRKEEILRDLVRIM